MPLTIRTAEPSEFAAVGELCVSAYEGLLPQDHFYIEVLRDAAARAADAGLLVAVDGDELLGTVTFVPEGGPLSEIAEPDESEFRMLAVSPAAQGRGIGTALLQRVLDDSRAAGRTRGRLLQPAEHARGAHDLPAARLRAPARARLVAGARRRSAGVRRRALMADAPTP